MKLLIDHDVYHATVEFLRGLGHDVVTAKEIGMAEASDTQLLQESQLQERVFITRNRDYGGLVFVQSLGAGVVYLRLLPSTLQSVHAELARVLSLYNEGELRGALVVVEPGRHRFRRPATNGGKG
jgi:predicted nuclease of predicted toxin-antitoxin system